MASGGAPLKGAAPAPRIATPLPGRKADARATSLRSKELALDERHLDRMIERRAQHQAAQESDHTQSLFEHEARHANNLRQEEERARLLSARTQQAPGLTEPRLRNGAQSDDAKSSAAQRAAVLLGTGGNRGPLARLVTPKSASAEANAHPQPKSESESKAKSNSGSNDETGLQSKSQINGSPSRGRTKTERNTSAKIKARTKIKRRGHFEDVDDETEREASVTID